MVVVRFVEGPCSLAMLKSYWIGVRDVGSMIRVGGYGGGYTYNSCVISDSTRWGRSRDDVVFLGG